MNAALAVSPINEMELKMKNFTVLILLVVSLSGCETLTGAWGKKSSIAFVKDSGGSLSVWNAEMSAAVAYESGQICMQRALAVKTIDTNTAVKVSDTMLALAKAAQTSTTGGELASITTSLKETASLLTTSTERTTFLDLGMFYLCQISANGGLTDTQTAELVQVIALAGAGINASGGSTTEKATEIEITSGDNAETPKTTANKANQQDAQ